MFLSLDWKVDGCWRLVYSTISILGSKRTKLGLRDFISLDEFFQIIDVAKVQLVFTLHDITWSFAYEQSVVVTPFLWRQMYGICLCTEV